MIDEAVAMLGVGDWKIKIRSDSAAYEEALLDDWNLSLSLLMILRIIEIKTPLYGLLTRV
jgi:hypothetical protein